MYGSWTSTRRDGILTIARKDGSTRQMTGGRHTNRNRTRAPLPSMSGSRHSTPLGS